MRLLAHTLLLLLGQRAVVTPLDLLLFSFPLLAIFAAAYWMAT